MSPSRLKRGPFGVRYVVCGGCGDGYREHRNAAFWTTGGLTSPGLVYYECQCGRHHEITRYKPAGAGWRRPLVYHREVSSVPAWAVAVRRVTTYVVPVARFTPSTDMMPGWNR